MDGNPESARLLRQWIDEDLDGMPAVCLMAVKMVTGALSEEGHPSCVGAFEPETSRADGVSNSASTD
jgi:hypothetical protein